MKKRAYIIHGWGGNPTEAWFPWLANQLEQKGFEVVVPQMPDPEEPKIGAWVSTLADCVGKPDEHTILVGHSIGCPTILRYLEGLPKDAKVGHCVFVAGWFTLKGLESEEEWAIAKPWLETPINEAKVRSACKSFTAFFSDNDPFVPLENVEAFEKRLQATTVVLHNRGHFGSNDDTKAFPELFNSCIEK